MPNMLRFTALLLAANCAASDTAMQDSAAATAPAAVSATDSTMPDEMPNGEQPGAWRSLASLSAWRGYKTQDVSSGWQQAGDTIMKSAGTKDLVSRDQYGDFELEFDWRLSKGGNAGVFYRATEEGEKIYWTGTEYQLLDDANHADGRSRLTSAGSIYGLYAPPAGVVKPAGEWNTARIVARGPHVEHWLNGQKVAETEFWSPEWEAKVKASKFNEWKGYGRSKSGHLGIQGDHTGELSLRNLRIRELK